MDEPQIRYVKTADGVNIAYYDMGQGVPYVYMTSPFSHLTAEWQWYGELFSGIASTARLVHFDPRGFGLSDRSPEDLSLDGFTMDLEAVVERLELPPMILVAGAVSSWVGVNYAARHPGRVGQLILFEAGARFTATSQQQLKAALATGEDWRFVSETMVRFLQGWDRPDSAARSAAFLRECVDLDVMHRLFDSNAWDVTDILPLVQARALVVNTRENPWAGVQAGRQLAAGLPNAQLAIVQRPDLDEMLGSEAVLAIQSFLGVPAPQAVSRTPARAQAAPTGTAIILFADVVDSTALTERIGDAAFHERSRPLDAELRHIVSEAGGTAIDARTLGDGVLATFPAAAQAITAALRCVEEGERAGLPLHLGIHAGDVVRDANNVFGGAVIVASRISGLSAPGEVLVSDIVRGLARTSASVTFEDRGEHALKGVGEPQRVYAVRRRD
jgi:class 3 adenylate cyclase/pimeloyl-ACP methyl ester carboxylesterase